MKLRHFLILWAAMAPAVAPGAGAQELNWIVNGDFKSADGWGRSLQTDKGHRGLAVTLENSSPTWVAYQQNVDFPGPAPAAIEVSGWLKTENVKRGMNGWEMARITVVFYDSHGQRLGDWPAAVASVEGTRDWSFYLNQYAPPKGTARARISLTLDNCVGKAWFSDPRCLVYDYDLKPLPRGAQAHPDRQAAVPPAGENWLINPGFEVPGSRDWRSASVGLDGHGSMHCLYLDNVLPQWSQPAQILDFKGQKPAQVVFGGWMRTQGVVQGAENYMNARMGLDFKDAQGNQVAGWQAAVCGITGDSEWTWYERKYAVPEGAVAVEVFGGLAFCVGRAWLDDLSLKLLDTEGKALTTVVTDYFQKTDTSGWWAYAPPSDPSGAGIDLSWMNEAPAGKRGFVRVKDGHFVHADGTRARFWGTNLAGSSIFVTHEEADSMALRLARLGVNLVRLHAADASWAGDHGFFTGKTEDTLGLNPEALDRYAYLVSALKKRGIHLYIDFIVSRRFRPADGVDGAESLGYGAKGAVHYDRRVIELNQRYATQILSHPNPYTGMALKDDPAYVGSEIVNESSIFSGFGEQKLPEVQWAKLQGLYEAWGGKGELTRFKNDHWKTGKLVPTANPENEAASLRFLMETLLKSNLEMRDFLRKLSPHALIAGSNMGLPILGNLRGDAALDFMDTHAYWDHPQVSNVPGGWANVALAPMDNQSQLRAPFKGSLIFNLSHARVEGKPLIVTEWNDCFPNEYRIEGPMLMMAYGSLQDWDGMLQFDYTPAKTGTTKMSNFSINTRPDNEALFQLGSVVFRQGLLKPAPGLDVDPVSDEDVVKPGMRSERLYEAPWLPYLTRVAKRFTGKAAEKATPPSAAGHDAAAKVLVSSTGEQRLDYGKGLLTIDAPGAQGFAGALGGAGALKSSGLTVELEARNPWAVVAAASLEGKPLADSSKILLAAVGRAENSGQVFNAIRTALKVPGEPPILMQGVAGSVALRVGPGRWTVSPLDPEGKPAPALRSAWKDGELRVEISPGDRASLYRIERTDRSDPPPRPPRIFPIPASPVGLLNPSGRYDLPLLLSHQPVLIPVDWHAFSFLRSGFLVTCPPSLRTSLGPPQGHTSRSWAFFFLTHYYITCYRLPVSKQALISSPSC